jgi:hypothetical protein
MLDVRDLPITEAVYTFTDNSGGVTHIAASTLLRGLQDARGGQGWPVTLCVIGETLVEALKRGDLGVEPAHALRLPSEALEAPGIIGQWGDAHISIDGAHRLWRRWQRGDTDFPAYVVPEALWREFVIKGIGGSHAQWHHWNKHAQVRTPEMEALLKLLGAQ